MNNDDRRVGAAQVGVAQLDAAAVDQRRLVLLHGGFEDFGHALGRDLGHGAFVGLIHRLVQQPDTTAMQRGNEMLIGKLGEDQPALQLLLHIVLLPRLHAIPLVDRHHQRPARLQHEAQQVQVLFDDTFPGIDHEDHHVGVLDRLQGLDHRELLDGLEYLAAAAHPGGVDQGVGLAMPFVGDIDTVAGGTGLIEHHHTVLTEHAVDQRRLADVGSTDDGDLGTDRGNRDALYRVAVLIQLRLGLDLSVHQHGFEHGVDIAPVGGGNADRRAQPQRGKLADNRVLISTIDLVGNQEGVLVALAQVLGNHLVACGAPGPGVDQEQHGVGFLDGLQGLPGHDGIDAVLIAGQTTGVHHDESPALPDGFPVLAVTGQPGNVGDDGVTTLGQAVEQGGLADVGPTDQGDNRNHAYSAHHRCHTKTKRPLHLLWSAAGKYNLFRLQRSW